MAHCTSQIASLFALYYIYAKCGAVFDGPLPPLATVVRLSSQLQYVIFIIYLLFRFAFVSLSSCLLIVVASDLGELCERSPLLPPPHAPPPALLLPIP